LITRFLGALMEGGDTCGFLIIFAFLLGAGVQALPQRTTLSKMLAVLLELKEATRDTDDKEPKS